MDVLLPISSHSRLISYSPLPISSSSISFSPISPTVGLTGLLTDVAASNSSPVTGRRATMDMSYHIDPRAHVTSRPPDPLCSITHAHMATCHCWLGAPD